jgi:hypothetical protein
MAKSGHRAAGDCRLPSRHRPPTRHNEVDHRRQRDFQIRLARLANPLGLRAKLVLRRPLNTLHHHDLLQDLPTLQPQPKLLLQRPRQRRLVIIRRRSQAPARIRIEIQQDVELSLNPGLIYNRPPRRILSRIRQLPVRPDAADDTSPSFIGLILLPFITTKRANTGNSRDSSRTRSWNRSTSNDFSIAVISALLASAFSAFASIRYRSELSHAGPPDT